MKPIHKKATPGVAFLHDGNETHRSATVKPQDLSWVSSSCSCREASMSCILFVSWDGVQMVLSSGPMSSTDAARSASVQKSGAERSTTCFPPAPGRAHRLCRVSHAGLGLQVLLHHSFQPPHDFSCLDLRRSPVTGEWRGCTSSANRKPRPAQPPGRRDGGPVQQIGPIRIPIRNRCDCSPARPSPAAARARLDGLLDVHPLVGCHVHVDGCQPRCSGDLAVGHL